MKALRASIPKEQEGIRIELLLVTPAMGQEFLKKRAKNRKILEYHVRELLSDMTGGNWIFNGIPIVFNVDGELIEGQHRLEALVRSGIAQWFVVIWGVSQSAFDTYDLHSKRSTKDYLSMSDYHYPSQVAAATRFLTLYKQYRRFYVKEPASHKAKMQILTDNPDLVSFVAAYAKGKIPLRMSSAMLAVCHILFKEKNPKAADEFMDGLVMGENLSKGDPRLATRNWINKRPVGELGWASRDFSTRAGNIIVHAWNCWRTGEQVTVIKPIRETEAIHS